MTLKKSVLFAFLSLLLPGLLAGAGGDKALAASFNKNNIMSDAAFDDSGSMSQTQIQAFLNGFPSSCLKNYSSGYPVNYFDYAQPVPAAKTIRRAADLWHINPRVILTTLEKEESLVSGGGGCQSWRYNSAMGMGCPDGGACPAPEYAGFSHQVTKGSWQLKFSKERAYGNLAWDNDQNVHYYGFMTAGNRSRQSGQPTQYYDGYATIDGQPVYMSNGTTAALYTYTPHFHGNQNFFTLFNQYFGTTYKTFGPLDTPRWMKTVGTIYKKDPFSGDNVDDALPAGSQLKFVDKISTNGVSYLRTESDSQSNSLKGIPQSSLAEISYQALDTPRYMQVTSNTYKVNPRTGVANKSFLVKKDSSIFFTDKILVNGQWYYRTSHDSSRNTDSAILASKVSDLVYSPFQTPRYMVIKNDTVKQNPATGEKETAVVAKNTQLKFSSKVLVGNTWYYRTDTDTASDTALAVSASGVQDIAYQAFQPSPKWLRLKTASPKRSPSSGVVTTQPLPIGTQMQVSQQITVNGVAYYRTPYDVVRGIDEALPASSFEEIPYISLPAPTWLKLKVSTPKINPRLGSRTSGPIAQGQQVQVEQQIIIGGITYYRTPYDVIRGIDEVLPASSLGDIAYISLDSPRSLTLNKNASQYNPKTGQVVGGPLSQGTSLDFSTKIYIDGQWYLRTKYDTTYKLDKGILLSKLNL